MTASDEFIPDTAELQAFLAVALTPEISRASAELGVESTYSAHAFAITGFFRSRLDCSDNLQSFTLCRPDARATSSKTCSTSLIRL